MKFPLFQRGGRRTLGDVKGCSGPGNCAGRLGVVIVSGEKGAVGGLERSSAFYDKVLPYVACFTLRFLSLFHPVLFDCSQPFVSVFSALFPVIMTFVGGNPSFLNVFKLSYFLSSCMI